jgi:hypothetical protein
MPEQDLARGRPAPEHFLDSSSPLDPEDGLDQERTTERLWISLEC